MPSLRVVFLLGISRMTPVVLFDWASPLLKERAAMSFVGNRFRYTTIGGYMVPPSRDLS